MIKNFYEMNEYLGEVLQKGDPASIIRIDNTAGYVMDCIVKQIPISTEFYNNMAILEGGVFPNTVEYGINVAYNKAYHCMLRADSVGFVDISKAIRNGSPLTDAIKEKVLFFTDGFMVFDPGAILGYAKLYIENLPRPTSFEPWTQYLKDKKVLVVSTHVDSIKYQWDRRHLVWGDQIDKILPFELVDVIRAPYHPDIDDRQYPNCENWEQSVNYMMHLIEQYDFDVLLSGASTSSPLLVDHAKKIGKIGIQTGGVLQLFFGVKGGRWAKVPNFADWHKMFNEHWIYPLQTDQAQKRDAIPGLESSFAYWG